VSKLPAASPLEDTPALRRQIVAACLQMQRLGCFVGTWGNVSVRLRAGLLVTPSRMDYDRMKPADIVACDWDGRARGGTRLPSSEMHLHRLLLHRRADFGAIIHSHSPYASVVACLHRTLPVIVEDMAQIIGGPVHCSRYARGGRHVALAEAACRAIGGQAAAVLLASHGALVGGRDLAEALVASQVLEKAAFTYVTASAVGRCRAIPASAVRAERDRFLYKYGTKADANG
jgi:L-fuculose-phosphate aldolase